jgi:hypothetical protein
LDYPIKPRQIAHSGWAEKRRGESQPEPTSNFFQGDIVARFRTGLIQLVRRLGINDFLRTQFG